MNTVWVVQEGKNDYASAEEFGQITFITKSDMVKYEGSRQNAMVNQDIRSFMSKYIPGMDYIIPSGNPAIVATVLLSIGRWPHCQHKILKWDGRRALYVPFIITPIE